MLEIDDELDTPQMRATKVGFKQQDRYDNKGIQKGMFAVEDDSIQEFQISYKDSTELKTQTTSIDKISPLRRKKHNK